VHLNMCVCVCVCVCVLGVYDRNKIKQVGTRTQFAGKLSVPNFIQIHPVFCEILRKTEDQRD